MGTLLRQERQTSVQSSCVNGARGWGGEAVGVWGGGEYLVVHWCPTNGRATPTVAVSLCMLYPLISMSSERHVIYSCLLFKRTSSSLFVSIIQNPERRRFLADIPVLGR